LSDTIPIQNRLENGGALLPLLYSFALEYTIIKIQENQVGLKLNKTHQLLVYDDDVTLLGDNIHTINKNIDVLTDASKAAGLELDTEKTKYMFVSCHQNAGHNYKLKIANRPFENVARLK
jgi:hypothetical protein